MHNLEEKLMSNIIIIIINADRGFFVEIHAVIKWSAIKRQQKYDEGNEASRIYSINGLRAYDNNPMISVLTY